MPCFQAFREPFVSGQGRPRMSKLRVLDRFRKLATAIAVVTFASSVTADEGAKPSRIRFFERTSSDVEDTPSAETISVGPPLVKDFEIRNPAEIRFDRASAMKAVAVPDKTSISPTSPDEHDESSQKSSPKGQERTTKRTAKAAKPVESELRKSDDLYVSRLAADVDDLSDEVRRLAQSLSTSKIANSVDTTTNPAASPVDANVFTVSDQTGVSSLRRAMPSDISLRTNLPPIVDARVRPVQATSPAPGTTNTSSPLTNPPTNPPATPSSSSPTGRQDFFRSSVASGGVQQIIDIFQGPTGPGATFALDRYLKNIFASNGQDRANAADIGIQGIHSSQINGGSHWIAARADLDTRFGKIDPHLVERVTVTKGPYNVMEGPGFAFYDIDLLPAPRYCNGYESHGQTIINYETNGSQIYGRQSLWGGSSDWGYRIGYAHAVGHEYEAGDGERFAGSYEARLPDVALGVDITPNSGIDFHYIRADQKDVDFPGQIFDLDDLVTDAYQIKYELRDQKLFDRFVLEAWHNRTEIFGNAKRIEGVEADGNVVVLLSDESTVDAYAHTVGYAAHATWGTSAKHVTFGTDLRRDEQLLIEEDKGAFNDPEVEEELTFVIPRSHVVNPGIFFNAATPIGKRSALKSGARIDWTSTNASTAANRYDPPLSITNQLLDEQLEAEGGFDQYYATWSAFARYEKRIGCHVKFNAGVGHAMRPPSMTELYSNQPYLAVFPQIQFNRPLGNPLLDPERLWQVDLGLQYNSKRLYWGVNAFQSWIQDYITLDAGPGEILRERALATNGSYTWTNTDLATIAGVNANVEASIAKWLVAFGNLAFVEGRDHTRRGSNSPIRLTRNAEILRERSFVFNVPTTDEEPLPIMPPLEARLGLRFQPMEAFGFEFVARIVDNQDRVATSLFEAATPGFTTFDLHSRWQPTSLVAWTASVTNLTDKNYLEHFDPHVLSAGSRNTTFRQPGRSFHVGAEFTY